MAAADAAAAALEYDPYDEAALRVLLRAQVMGGRVAAALAAYASTRERLADELGTDPSPETEFSAAGRRSARRDRHTGGRKPAQIRTT